VVALAQLDPPLALIDEPVVVEVSSVHVDSVIFTKVVSSLEFFPCGEGFVEFLTVTKSD
jgi:hypothetical protein